VERAKLSRSPLLFAAIAIMSALALQAEKPRAATAEAPQPTVARAEQPCRDDAARTAGPCRLLPLRGWAYVPVPHYNFGNVETIGQRDPESGAQTVLSHNTDVAPAPARNPQDPPSAAGEYRIGSGDVLQISVWREPEVSVSGVAVRSDGKISLPLVKEIYVADLTPAELEQVLSEKFSQFINSPVVTVITSEIHSQKVFLIGGVDRPGSLELRTPMTVLQVLAEAGGLTEFAKRRKIYVLRKKDSRQIRLPFDYDSVIKGHQPEQNFTVQPGDTIVVPE
jgi:polysaccharide export outer membrane protein